MNDSTTNQVRTTPLATYLELLADLTARNEPYHIDYGLGLVTTQYQTWQIVIPDEALKLIRLEEV